MSSLTQKASFIFKQGDSFEFSVNLKDPSGLPLVITTANIKSEVRQGDGTLIDTLVITNGGSDGEYVATGQNTSNYPVGQFYIDFKINYNAKIISSPTILIEVEKAITQW